MPMAFFLLIITQLLLPTIYRINKIKKRCFQRFFLVFIENLLPHKSLDLLSY